MDIKNIAAYGSQTSETKETAGDILQNINTKEAGSISGIADVLIKKSSVQTNTTGIYTSGSLSEDNLETVQAKNQERETISVLTGADYANLEKEEGSVMGDNPESVERAVEKLKEQKALDARRMQEGLDKREEMQEDLEEIRAQGFLSQKSEAQLRELLEESNIPATEEKITQILAALEMAQDALDMTEQTKVFLVGQNLAPTIENLYQGKYSVYAADSANAKEQDFSEYEKQIQKILEDCQRTDTNGQQDARWLFLQELPINEGTLEKLSVLRDIQENMTVPQVLEQILFSLSSGYSAREANLDTGKYDAAKEAVIGFASISDAAVDYTAAYMAEAVSQKTESAVLEEEEGIVNLKLLQRFQEKVEAEEGDVSLPDRADEIDSQEILQITLKRQLEEIRQKMTVQAAMNMEQKGIHVDTESLETVLEQLRNMENRYYSMQMAEDTEVLTDEALDLFQETLFKTTDIANAHASLLGSGVRQYALLTLNELHAAAGSAVSMRQEWQGVYETVATQARSDMGDSIQKAFSNIPEILEDLGMETTEANERAVRILGYNTIELTEKNITEVKLLDAKVNQVIENMKPSTVLELIRQGENPLQLPLDQLNEELAQINKEKDITSEEKYSRYLWQLEKSDQITEEERAGYIGVYRLLNQIEQSDGAVIGAVMEAGQELTLGNLLTQSRTRKSGGIDSKIDDTTGISQAAFTKPTITDQIEIGFSRYQQQMVSKALQEITPSKLSEMTDGNLEQVMEMTVEKFSGELQKASGDEKLQEAYYEQAAEELRETLEDNAQAQNLLEMMQADVTVENLMAAKLLLTEGFSAYKEFYKEKKKLLQEEQESLEEIVDSFDEAAEDEESLNAQCAEAEKIMQEVLTKSSEQADITFEDLKNFQQISRGIRLEGVFRSSHSYEIPIRTEEGITALNLTIIHGAEESGKIQVSMEDEESGNISMDFQVSEGSIKGLVLCDTRQMFEELQEQSSALSENLENAGYQVKNISYGMDFKSRNEMLFEEVQNQEADTGQLYQIAKILVRSVTSAIRKTNSKS